MQEKTTNEWVLFHPPRFTTSRNNRRIVRMAVMDCAATSRTIAQQIQSVTHHSVSTRTIRRRWLKSGISASCPLLRLHLTRNHRRLRHQWFDERRTWTTE
ncbi:transposable element Tc1 transposase [Trichonephila clavipes]|nr:transposable element Tc1 transposase [Trichonephila clavipes]